MRGRETRSRLFRSVDVESETSRCLFIDVVMENGYQEYHETLESAVASMRQNGQVLELFESVISTVDYMPIGRTLLRITAAQLPDILVETPIESNPNIVM